MTRIHDHLRHIASYAHTDGFTAVQYEGCMRGPG